MQFKRVDTPPLRAEKLSGTGDIYYIYWVDHLGNEYVQIDNNFGGTGSFSSDLYRVDELDTYGHPTGYDLETGIKRISYDNNTNPFLRGIKADIDQRLDKEKELRK